MNIAFFASPSKTIADGAFTPSSLTASAAVAFGSSAATFAKTASTAGRSFAITSLADSQPHNSSTTSRVGCRAMSTEDDLKAELARLKAENESLKARTSKGISLKVSEKGAVSVYGMGRFPVTLYKEQWLKLLDMNEDIRRFIAENDSKLKAKD